MSRALAFAILIAAPIFALAGERGSSDDVLGRGIDVGRVLKAARDTSGDSAPVSLKPLERLADAPRELTDIVVPAGMLEEFIIKPFREAAGARTSSAAGRILFPDLPSNPTQPCENPNPDDDGTNSSAAPGCVPPVEGAVCPEGPSVRALLPRFLRDLRIPGFRPVTGPYKPLPEDSAFYRDALILKQKLDGIGIRAVPVPPMVRERLLREFKQIESLRSGLIVEGGVLDSEDEALYADGVRLNIWRGRIEARSSVLKEYLARYNEECRSRPLPDNERLFCNNWSRRYNTCVDRQNASRARYRVAVEVWRKNRDSLLAKGAPFRSRVQDWEILQVKPWSEKAQKALDGSTGKCTETRYNELLDAILDSCREGPFICTPDQDCSQLRKLQNSSRACWKANNQINQECYEGANGNFGDAAKEALENAVRCLSIMREKRCEGPDQDKQTCIWTGRRIPPENGLCVYDCDISKGLLLPPTDGRCSDVIWDVPIPPPSLWRSSPHGSLR